ncbi:MAG TPA: prolyl oligopeptidase family serine peptidase [Xanthomonadaceae bacterium]|jgi:dipeptidyl aminopeptidase/acylaminoacyl peptidase
MHKAFLLPLSLAATTALAQPTLPTAPPTPITLDQAMADPDWIGPAVDSAWWSWDGRRAYFPLKRNGSPEHGGVRDLYGVDVSGGAPMTRVADPELANLDAINPVYDAAHRRAAFVRNGDMFVRDLRSGALTQLARGTEAAADPAFMAGDAGVMWHVENTWYRYRFDQRVVEVAAVLKAEKDPNAAEKPDEMRANQLRLIDTLRREKQAREAKKAQDRDLRAADPTRAAPPVYLGADVSIDGSSISPDGRWLIVLASPKDADAGRVGKLQKFVTESGYEEQEDERTRVGRNMPAAESFKLVDLRDGHVADLSIDSLPGIDVDPLAALRKAAGKDALKGHRALRAAGVQWTADGRQAAVELLSVDNKDRWIATVDFAGRAFRSAHRLTDQAWVNSFSFNDFGWMPDSRTLWLLSEQSGWSHLVTLVPGQAARERTRGEWETSTPQFSADGRRAWFVCNRKWPGGYEVCEEDLGNDEVKEITSLEGVEDFTLSPDQKQVLVRYSGSHLPAQLAVVPADGGRATVLTDTRTEAYKARNFLEPQFVQVPSSHGAKPIWAKLYRPAQLEPGKRYPIVMFVHGAGYLQNVFVRYPYYFREQMFNQLLVQQGYVVLDMDYRGSAGHGRDWRTAIYRNMGHPELEDYLDGVKWMAANAQGDAQHVGVYGGSYGGFMSLMAMFRAPDVFKAGAALRPVSDWSEYEHGYTSAILNTPDIDPEAYRTSSPIEFAEGLKGALLICHGMMDDNVFFQDSVRLVQRLIELHKTNWSIAPYPLERHGFEQADAWLDEYRRIDELFERTLK